MESLNSKWRSVSTKYGLLLFGAFSVYFLLMRFAGLGHEYWLRGLNIIWLLLAIFGTIRALKNKQGSLAENFATYFRGAIRTSFIGIGLFAIILAVYLDLIDPSFMAELQEYESFGGLISPISVSFLIFFEGMCSSLICSYIVIQLMKRKTVEEPLKSESKYRQELK
jgi:hypothetical protein